MATKREKIKIKKIRKTGSRDRNQIPTKPKAAASSIKGFLREILLLQFRHRPLRRRKERMGMLSYHAKFFLHFGQKDLPLKTDIPREYLKV
jgi:hypothetical protein